MYRNVITAVSIVAVLTFIPMSAQATGEVLLDCTREDGGPNVQVYINRSERYVLYNAQLRESYERLREYKLFDQSGEQEVGVTTIDEGLDIWTDDVHLIQARSNQATFIFSKDTATFAYAWTTPAQGSRGYFAFGNYHSGQCSANPFRQP